VVESGAAAATSAQSFVNILKRKDYEAALVGTVKKWGSKRAPNRTVNA
jgi:hypothetical protein